MATAARDGGREGHDSVRADEPGGGATGSGAGVPERAVVRALFVAASVVGLGLAAGPGSAQDDRAPWPVEGLLCPSLPPGHPPIGAMTLPPGHPPIDAMPGLPPGHPPVPMLRRLPSGHPPIPATRPPLLVPQQPRIVIT